MIVDIKINVKAVVKRIMLLILSSFMDRLKECSFPWPALTHLLGSFSSLEFAKILCLSF